VPHFWINGNVPQSPEDQVYADPYVAKDERKVMSLRKEVTFLI
jgi:hypothetical protein